MAKLGKYISDIQITDALPDVVDENAFKEPEFIAEDVTHLAHKDPYNWDHEQYSILHKHHFHKANWHTDMSKGHAPRTVNGIKMGDKRMQDHHTTLAKHHQAAADAMKALVVQHTNTPPVKIRTLR